VVSRHNGPQWTLRPRPSSSFSCSVVAKGFEDEDEHEARRELVALDALPVDSAMPLCDPVRARR
jgi:hypothetical protein